MKKFTNSLILTAIISIMAFNAQAQQTIIDQGECGVNGNNLTWVLTDDGVLTISGSGDMNNYYVDVPWYSNSASINSVIIGDSVASIGSYAFIECINVSSVIIGESVTTIGDGAFSECTTLSSVTIPNNVTSIGYGAFSGCSGLSSITIPNSVTTIGYWAFAYCNSLPFINIPNSVTSIEYGAFASCINLTNIDVDANNSTYISIDGVLFNKAQNILHAYPAGKQDTSYIIPNYVIIIDSYAFYGCPNLSSVTIPDSVTIIGGDAFKYCSNLSSITISNNVTFIGQEAFCYCPSLVIVNFNATNCTEMWLSFWLYCDAFTTLNIGNNVTNFPDCAFAGCSSLSSITIPNSVTNFGLYAFADCNSLSSIIVNWETPLAISNVVFNHLILPNINLYVPYGTKASYAAADVWKEFNIIETLGTNDIISNSQLQIFPNPVQNEVFIKTEFPINKIEVYTLLGNLLISESKVTDKISVSILPPNTYLLKIYTDKGIFIENFIKK